MLTDIALKSLKPKDKPYKVSDRDGMYAHVTTSGAVTFRLDYRLNGRRETVTLGRYGPGGLSLALARERCIDARRAVTERRSPALEKQRERRRLAQAKNFGEFAETWFAKAPMADSTRSMRRSIYDREIAPVRNNRLLTELLPDDLREHCGRIVDRGAPATVIHVRDITKQIFGLAILHGEKVRTPPTRLARPRSRLSCHEIDRCRRPRSGSCSSSWTMSPPCRPYGSACGSSCLRWSEKASCEPRRVSWRHFGVCHAAIARLLMAA